eukprot:CAMPEP_0172004604 /NCGR_PEP_ID=MMETSP1041-20130122/4573_1 /TAXON_ID=464988 /ORGANISM="Hemiselmis andersenii, Strain CCMP439" /LENGTH=218 /DNA_ID=CAMNT_0012658485 /DNA_START=207 /DNA_END=864 /DNA_ORIENTATION=+
MKYQTPGLHSTPLTAMPNEDAVEDEGQKHTKKHPQKKRPPAGLDHYFPEEWEREERDQFLFRVKGAAAAAARGGERWLDDDHVAVGAASVLMTPDLLGEPISNALVVVVVPAGQCCENLSGLKLLHADGAFTQRSPRLLLILALGRVRTVGIGTVSDEVPKRNLLLIQPPVHRGAIRAHEIETPFRQPPWLRLATSCLGPSIIARGWPPSVTAIRKKR